MFRHEISEVIWKMTEDSIFAVSRNISSNIELNIKVLEELKCKEGKCKAVYNYIFWSNMYIICNNFVSYPVDDNCRNECQWWIKGCCFFTIRSEQIISERSANAGVDCHLRFFVRTGIFSTLKFDRRHLIWFVFLLLTSYHDVTFISSSDYALNIFVCFDRDI